MSLSLKMILYHLNVNEVEHIYISSFINCLFTNLPLGSFFFPLLLFITHIILILWLVFQVLFCFTLLWRSLCLVFIWGHQGYQLFLLVLFDIYISEGLGLYFSKLASLVLLFIKCYFISYSFYAFYPHPQVDHWSRNRYCPLSSGYFVLLFLHGLPSALKLLLHGDGNR